MPKNYSTSKIPNWYVITGGPSSGKTTVLNELKKLGFITYPETARALIDKEIKEGKRIEEIRKNEAKFQGKVFKAKEAREKRAPKTKTIFFDRGIPDSLAYYKMAGLDEREVYKTCKKKNYKKIFFLEQLPYKKDYARIEDVKTVKRINRLLKESYINLGYQLVKIPVMSIGKRIKTILKEVKNN